jgi:hypothetical protein
MAAVALWPPNGMELALRSHKVHLIGYANPIHLDPEPPAPTPVYN